MSLLSTTISSIRAGSSGAENKSRRTPESAVRLSFRYINSVSQAFCALLLLCGVPAFSQNTTINLGTQGRNPDFAAQPFTRPVTVGTSLPAVCQVGQLFFNSASAAGSNLYGCTGVNVWTVLANNSSSVPTGSGLAALSPASLSFGNQLSGTASPAQAVSVSNTGTGALSISGITVSGANAGDFAVTNNCGSSLGVGLTCTIAAIFTPSSTAAESGTITISDNAVGAPQTIALTGTGTAAAGSSTPVVTPAAPSTTVGTPLTLTANKSVTWALASGSAGSISGSGTSAVYTPPSSIVPLSTRGGCMVLPNDSVFNTRIDNLPVNSNSATWMNSFILPITIMPSWGTNIIDNTVPQTVMLFYYTPSYNGNFQIAPQPERKRETGSLTVDGNNDHHMLSVNKQTCQFYETYQDSMPLPSNVCAGCTAVSGYQYNSASYTQPTDGTTDAAGLPLAPITMHLSEIKAGAIKHALRFTLCTGCINSATFLWPATESNGSATPTAPPMGARFRLKKSVVPSGIFALNVSAAGSGYTSSPTVTITGCQTAPSATAMVTGGTVTSLVLNSPGAGCSSPVVSFGGPGTGASATATVFSANAQVILTALQQYGMFLADNGGSAQIEADSDLFQDASVAASLTEIANAKIGAAYFEVVDESSLMVSATSHRVNPSNGYVTPANYAVVTATDGSGNTTTLPIAVQPVIVGVPYTKMTIQAGMTGYQLQSWVNGSTNQNVAWTLTSGPGTITSGGIYTPPATVSAQSAAVLTATAAADSNATATVYMNIIPGGLNPANSVRIDVGNATSNYTDSTGNIWLTDTLGYQTGINSVQNDNYPVNAWGGATNAALFETYFYTYGDDITYGPFIVPNGNYKIGFGIAEGNCTTFSETTVFNNGLISGPVELESQGLIQLHFNLGYAVNYACRVPYTAYIPAQVTNNLVYASIRSTGGSNAHSVPFLNALSIIPDSTPAYLSIDTQNVTTTTEGSVLQMYAVGWYMSNAVTWSVSGGGSIDQTGLYTAPATVTSNQTVTITATSTANSAITATATLTVAP